VLAERYGWTPRQIGDLTTYLLLAFSAPNEEESFDEAQNENGETLQQMHDRIRREKGLSNETG